LPVGCRVRLVVFPRRGSPNASLVVGTTAAQWSISA
jgi:hypothetical protein